MYLNRAAVNAFIDLNDNLCYFSVTFYKNNGEEAEYHISSD